MWGSNYKQLKHVSKSALLEEANHLRFIFRGVILLAILIGSLILWASLAEIKETAVTYGTLIPKGQIQVVQHLEGGIVTKVLVDEGGTVKKGQLLLTIDPTTVRSELEQMQSRQITLTLNSERLRAFLK